MPEDTKKKKKPGGGEEDDNPIIGQAVPQSGVANRMGLFNSTSYQAPGQAQPVPQVQQPILGMPQVPPQTAEIIAEQRRRNEETPPQNKRSVKRRAING